MRPPTRSSSICAERRTTFSAACPSDSRTLPRGGEADAPPAARKAGRPKLGVVGREVTLLPRHWDWLAEQPGGASVAIRKLIDAERKSKSFNDLKRKIQAATYRFINAMAGNFQHFEEACRALFAGDREKFATSDGWLAGRRARSCALADEGGTFGDACKTGAMKRISACDSSAREVLV